MALPSATCLPSTVPIAPLPDGEVKSLTSPSVKLALLRGLEDRLRQRMLAAALDAGGEPQQFVFVEALGGDRSPTTFGLPSVSVPVLSITSVSMLSIRSSASASRIRMPECAPRPTPTMIDIGVARPSAQGQAMISTVTAATRPKVKRGSGPNSAQAANADQPPPRSPPARTSRRR